MNRKVSDIVRPGIMLFMERYTGDVEYADWRLQETTKELSEAQEKLKISRRQFMGAVTGSATSIILGGVLTAFDSPEVGKNTSSVSDIFVRTWNPKRNPFTLVNALCSVFAGIKLRDMQTEGKEVKELDKQAKDLYVAVETMRFEQAGVITLFSDEQNSIGDVSSGTNLIASTPESG